MFNLFKKCEFVKEFYDKEIEVGECIIKVVLEDKTEILLQYFGHTYTENNNIIIKTAKEVAFDELYFLKARSMNVGLRDYRDPERILYTAPREANILQEKSHKVTVNVYRWIKK